MVVWGRWRIKIATAIIHKMISIAFFNSLKCDLKVHETRLLHFMYNYPTMFCSIVCRRVSAFCISFLISIRNSRFFFSLFLMCIAMLASSLSIWYITTQNGKIVQWRKITAGFHYTKSVCACYMLSWVERGFFKIFLLKVSNSGKIFVLRNIEFFIKTPMIVQQSEKERHKKVNIL